MIAIIVLDLVVLLGALVVADVTAVVLIAIIVLDLVVLLVVLVVADVAVVVLIAIIVLDLTRSSPTCSISSSRCNSSSIDSNNST